MRKHKLWMNDIVFDEESIIFSSGQFNGLFRAGIYGGEAEFINFFPNDPKLQSRLHGDAFKYKDEILFLPDLSDYITLYNITQKDFTCMKFPVEDENPTMQYVPKIVFGILVDSCVYAFGAKYPCVVCYNFETKQLKIYDEGIQRFEKNGYKAGTVFFSRNNYRVENSIFIRCYTNDDVIVEFDIEAKRFDFHRVEKLLLNDYCDEAERIWLLKEAVVGQKIQCNIFSKNKMWFFPYMPSSIMIVDVQSGKGDMLDLFESDMNKWYPDAALGVVWFRKIYEDKLFFMSVLENKLYCFNDNEQEEFRAEIYADRNEMVRLLISDKRKLYEPKEEKRCLWKFNYNIIDVVETDEWKNKEQNEEHIQFGKMIYDYLSK